MQSKVSIRITNSNTPISKIYVVCTTDLGKEIYESKK